MEMAPMMTQPQGNIAPLSGMSATGNAPGSSRQSAIPVLFADLLQEKFPLAEEGVELPVVAVSQTSPDRTAPQDKEISGVDLSQGVPNGKETAGEQQPDPVDYQLAQLVALAGQISAEQPLTRSGVQSASQSTALMETGGINAPGITAEAPGSQAQAPSAIAGEGVDLTPQQTSQSADLQTVRTGVLATGRSDEPAQPTVASTPRGQAAGQDPTIQPASGGVHDLLTPWNRQAIDADSSLGGDKIQVQTFSPVSSAPMNPAAAGNRFENTSDTAYALVSQTAPVQNYTAYNKPVTAEEVGSTVPPLQSSGAVDGNAFNVLVAAVVADTSSNAKTSDGNGKSESGSKEKSKESVLGSDVAMARTMDVSGTNRSALQPKVEEARNPLHESILSQVKESVVNHDGKGNGMISIRLNPAELGDLQVNLRIENHQVKVEIITENRTVRDALMGNLDNLKDTFLKQNLTMERFEVVSGGSNGFSHGFRDEKGDQRRVATIPSGHESAPFETARDSSTDDWGVTENSLVNLRL